MKRSTYVLAALTSAVLPNMAVAGVRESVQPSATDEAKGIDQAVIQDASGKLYDVYATDTKEGRQRLIRRVQAAQTLAAAREPGALGFDLDRVIAFAPGQMPQPGQTSTAQAFNQPATVTATQPAGQPNPTGETTVMITMHSEGQARSLDLLTLDDCASVGTALGAIHRLPPAFLTAAKYPVFTTGQIRSQLTAWIKRLRSAGHVPTEITNSWARIIETEGLWSFATCTVHGGFSDGDFLFSGSTITTVTNWQDMQVNDPARDLAWIFGKLDESHRNTVLSAYGRMMGSRLDDLIMLRANLWLQMEQVGDFIQALNRGDNERIMQFKAQVERLAHQLGVISRDSTPAPSPAAASAPGKPNSPSTITVGTLLQEDKRRDANAATVASAVEPSDDTSDSDSTGSTDIKVAGNVDMTPIVAPASDRTADRPRVSTPIDEADRTAGHPKTGTGSTTPQPAHVDSPNSSVTITLKELIDLNEQHGAVKAVHSAAGHAGANTSADDSSDDTGTSSAPVSAAPGPAPASASSPSSNDRDDADDTGERESAHTPNTQTIVIPLLEREERALRDAHAGLAGYDDEGNPLNK